MLFKHSPSPTLGEVQMYFNQKKMSQAEANHFFLFYELKQWKSKNGNPYTNWKNLAHKWIVSAIAQQSWLFDKNIH
jgi:hypothetical protein